MLRSLADENFDGRWLHVFGFALLDDSLDGVAEELAYDVFEVAQNVGEGGIEVTIDLDVRYLNVRTMGAPDEVLGCRSTFLDNVSGAASQEYLTHGLLIVRGMWGLGKVPRRVESLGEGQMLLCDDASRDALEESEQRSGLGMIGQTYRSQHSGHELVCFLRCHEAANLKDANGQARDDSGMLGQGLVEHLAVSLVVLKRADGGNATEAFEGTQVELVNVGQVGIGNDDVGQRLDIAQTVGKPGDALAVLLEEGTVGRPTAWAARGGSSWPSRGGAIR